MEPHEKVLSDVHVFTNSYQSEKGLNVNVHDEPDELSVKLTRFPFHYANREDETSFGFDEDGDVCVRRTSTTNEVVVLEHAMATPLSFVGLQVWNGALLMSDFILHIGDTLKDAVVVELGSGTGLCSIVLSMFAKTIFCTDVGDEILDLCRRNIERNLHVRKWKDGQDGHVSVKQLDWLQSNPFNNKYWNSEEVTAAKTATVYVASDVIYDDDLTDAFFQTIQKLVDGRSGCTLFLSLEKRLNFTLDDLDVAAPSYRHFESWTQNFRSSKNLTWEIKKVAPFTKCFDYQRSKYLELWEFITKTTTRTR